MAATSEGLMTELRTLIREKQFEKAIAFLETNTQVLQDAKRKDKEIMKALFLQPPQKVDIYSTLFSLWELQNYYSFENYIQWLPKEMFEDTLALDPEVPKWLLYLELFNLLLECDLVDLNRGWGALKDTYLEYEVSKSNIFMANFLLEMGANVNAINSTKSVTPTALLIAVSNDNESMVKLLLDKGADVDEQDKYYGSTALHSAKSESIVRLVLDKKPDVNKQNKSGATALHYAFNAPIARLLLVHGADIEALDEKRDTPLHAAVRNKREDVVGLLLQKEAKVEAKNFYGETALHLAVRYQTLRIAELLIKNPVDVNAKTWHGVTPLQSAVEKGDERMVRLLLEANADINAENSEGETALDLAKKQGNESIARLLREAASTLPQAASTASSNLYSFHNTSASNETNSDNGQAHLENGFGPGAP